MAPPLHLAKQVGVRPADRRRILASLQGKGNAASVVAHRGGDSIQIDHRASVDLLEAIARQLREQLLQRCADQRLSLARRYQASANDD